MAFWKENVRLAFRFSYTRVRSFENYLKKADDCVISLNYSGP